MSCDDTSVLERLKDALRSDCPSTFTAEQLAHLFAIAYEDPGEPGRPISHWTNRELADELIKRDIVETISPRHVGRLLVVTGHIILPTCGDTLTEKDFADHIKQTIEADPKATKTHIVVDGLNTHMSETLVKLITEHEGMEIDPGKKGKYGIVFHYTPTHTSWMNQVEIWFSILVRKLLKRASFKSKEGLKNRLMAFIDYLNQNMTI